MSADAVLSHNCLNIAATIPALIGEKGPDKKGGKRPEGIISHTAGKSGNGWCAFDVWDSEQAFGRWASAIEVRQRNHRRSMGVCWYKTFTH